jgi:membrane-associated phospholipid phosphatase
VTRPDPGSQSVEPRQTRSGAARPEWWVAAGCGVTFALLTALVAAGLGWPGDWDRSVSAAAGRFGDSHPTWITTMAAITHAGDSKLLIPLNALLAAICAWRRRWRSAAVFISVILLVWPARVGLSLLIRRPRPLHPFVATSGWAYPSGHTTWAACTAIACVVALWPYLHTRAARWLAVGVAFVWTATVAISRVALLAHWPSDVIGASLFAVTAMALLTAAGRRLPDAPRSVIRRQGPDRRTRRAPRYRFGSR